MKRVYIYSLIFCMLNFIEGCLPKITPYNESEHFTSINGEPDYSILDYWAAHPLKKDPSDSIRKREMATVTKKDVDVFYLYPTTYTDELINEKNNADIDDRYINKKTDYTAILYQSSVFNKSCNVYGPRYRQAHISMYYTVDTLKRKSAFDLAYQDVKKAFLYYLKYENKGKPFIISSHSQGTTHAIRLIKECVDKEGVSDKLILAYLVGMPVKKREFNNIQLCKDSTDIGCFVSWRTFQNGYVNDYISLTDTSIGVVNPLSWEVDNEVVDAKKHMGAVLYNYNKFVWSTHSAQVIGNGLFISKPKFFGSFLIKMKNYHAGDYNLFYENIRHDVERRISIYYHRNM